MHKKIVLFALFVCFLTFQVFAEEDEFKNDEKYRISNVEYVIEGITKSLAMERNVSFDKERIFTSKSEFELYLERLKQTIENLRLLEDISISSELIGKDDDVELYNIVVHAKDSKHLIVLPKPGYSSNSGAELKLKLKDTNFLGLMNTLDSDLSLKYDNVTNPSSPAFTVGFGFNFDYPFNISTLQNTWSNSFNIGYTFGRGAPEFGITTGLGVGIPLGKSNLNLIVSQSLTKNLDYCVKENNSILYDDSLYFTESFGVNYPVLITTLYDVVPFSWTPYVTYGFNWDIDGIDYRNTALYKPALTFGESFGLNAINWIGNFRDGYSVSFSQSLSLLFDPELEADVVYVPYFDLDVKYFIPWGWAGLNSHFFAFWEKNSTKCIGTYLRGTLDARAYTSSAILLQVDVPIKLFKTDFRGMGLNKYGTYENFSWFAKVMSVFDCEVQASPYVDMALINKNDVYFNPKDGFYDAGLEVLVYPTRFKSFVIRLSGGIDLKDFKNVENKSIKSILKMLEISFGLGSNY